MAPPEPSPPAGVVDLDEQGWEHLRARYRGRVLLVNFWATWCEPCREEFPGIVRLHQSYRARGLSVVAIAMDEPGSVPAIEHFLKAQGAEFGSYRHHFHDFAALVDRINPRWGGGIPATFLYDREGKLVESWQGPTSFAEFERAVRPLVPGGHLRLWVWPPRLASVAGLRDRLCSVRAGDASWRWKADPHASKLRCDYRRRRP